MRRPGSGIFQMMRIFYPGVICFWYRGLYHYHVKEKGCFGDHQWAHKKKMSGLTGSRLLGEVRILVLQ